MLPKTDTFETQTGKLNRPFRLSGIEIIGTKEKKWINGEYKSCWKYIYKYLDGGFFSIDLDWNGKLIK